MKRAPESVRDTAVILRFGCNCRTCLRCELEELLREAADQVVHLADRHESAMNGKGAASEGDGSQQGKPESKPPIPIGPISDLGDYKKQLIRLNGQARRTLGEIRITREAREVTERLRQKHSDQTKENAIALAQEFSPAEAARKTGVKVGTINSWLSKLRRISKRLV